jgi:hypothetical protein
VEKKRPVFPRYGKVFGDFSMLWKKVFHTVEKFGPAEVVALKVFHAMEKYFPHCGKVEWERMLR